MKKLVTISRQYGSGGRDIGKILAEKLGVKFYDKEIIDLTMQESGFSREVIESAELKAKSGFAYNLSTALNFHESLGGALSINDKLFLAQFQAIKDIQEKEGEAVIVGRCADYVLKDVKNVTTIFVYAEKEDRINRAVTEYGDDYKTASELINMYDKARKNYYEHHTGQKWGDFNNYDLMINSSYISDEKAAELICDYIS